MQHKNDRLFVTEDIYIVKVFLFTNCGSIQDFQLKASVTWIEAIEQFPNIVHKLLANCQKEVMLHGTHVWDVTHQICSYFSNWIITENVSKKSFPLQLWKLPRVTSTWEDPGVMHFSSVNNVNTISLNLRIYLFMYYPHQLWTRIFCTTGIKIDTRWI